MFLKPYQINESTLVADIVTQNYRSAEVFRKYGIEYCCDGRQSLEMACNTREIDIKVLTRELYIATNTVQLPNSLPFNEWSLDFLADYIVHIHHYYLRSQLPEIKNTLLEFAEEHRNNYSYLPELEKTFLRLYNEMLPQLQTEEKIIFPYIRRISHAYNNQESYGSLLVRTLRKPVEEMMNHEHAMVLRWLDKMRELTGDYIPPAGACNNQRVTLFRLKELDNDLVQHMHVENNILFPRAIEMEKMLLSQAS
jgi:regulator of cell morphogenesis and NO signaling